MKWLGTLFLLVSVVALASAGGEEHHAAGVPRVVWWQAVNLAIIFGAVWYYLGDKIKATFQARQAAFLNDSEKSKSIQQEAEKKLLDIKHKISGLEDSEAESLERARAEAADMRNQLIAEAKLFAQRIKHEAESAAQVEIQNAKRELHAEMVRESVKQARDILQKDVGQADQQRLQEQFSKQVEGVRL